MAELKNVFTINGQTFHVKDIQEVGKLKIVTITDLKEAKPFDFFRAPENVSYVFKTKFTVYMKRYNVTAWSCNKYAKGDYNYDYDYDLTEVRDEIVKKWNDYEGK